MFRLHCLFVGLAMAAMALGCSSSVKEEQIPVKASGDPLSNAKSTLERYAKGQPLSSEVTSFPAMVKEVRKTDPAKADILEKGLADIEKASAAARPAKARELLKTLD